MANDNIFKQLGKLFRGNVIIRKTDDDKLVVKDVDFSQSGLLSNFIGMAPMERTPSPEKSFAGFTWETHVLELGRHAPTGRTLTPNRSACVAPLFGYFGQQNVHFARFERVL